MMMTLRLPATLCKHCAKPLTANDFNTAVYVKVFDQKAGLFRGDGPYHSKCAKERKGRAMIQPPDDIIFNGMCIKQGDFWRPFSRGIVLKVPRELIRPGVEVTARWHRREGLAFRADCVTVLLTGLTRVVRLEQAAVLEVKWYNSWQAFLAVRAEIEGRP